MASDIAARLEEAGRHEQDAQKREALFRDAALGLPRALYGLVLDRVVPAPAASLDDQIARAIFLRWAWETPDYAAAWAVKAPRGPFRMDALAEAGGRWGAKNPRAAVAWARGLATDDRLWVFAHAGRFSARPGNPGDDPWAAATAAEP